MLCEVLSEFPQQCTAFTL